MSNFHGNWSIKGQRMVKHALEKDCTYAWETADGTIWCNYCRAHMAHCGSSMGIQPTALILTRGAYVEGWLRSGADTVDKWTNQQLTRGKKWWRRLTLIEDMTCWRGTRLDPLIRSDMLTHWLPSGMTHQILKPTKGCHVAPTTLIVNVDQSENDTCHQWQCPIGPRCCWPI